MEKRLLKTLPSLAAEPECYLVYDKAVSWFAERLLAGGDFRGSLPLTVSDAGKTMDSVLDICRYLMAAGATRQALVVALGGGTLTDMAGFAASIYKRGIRYANIPTTLLAQVDAGIGGKTGVNLDGYKNMIGAFRQPEWVWLCPAVLSTLPERAFRCGVAELLKTFLVADASRYADAVRFLSISSSKMPISEDSLAELVWKAAEIKAGITERDPYDMGERRKLNFGHTFAHAIEHEALRRGDDIRHGEAVAMGMVLAAQLEDEISRQARNDNNVMPDSDRASLAERLAADFAACGLPVACPYPMAALVDAMRLDKKGETDGVRFVLLRQIGETEERLLTMPALTALLLR